jgi:hypothetical protein
MQLFYTVLILTKFQLGNILGDFLTNSSGHPAAPYQVQVGLLSFRHDQSFGRHNATFYAQGSLLEVDRARAQAQLFI